MMKVICPSHQCAAPAALWHDGQITAAGEKPVKGFFVPSREAIASSHSPQDGLSSCETHDSHTLAARQHVQHDWRYRLRDVMGIAFAR
jgi:hypothetical protein